MNKPRIRNLMALACSLSIFSSSVAAFAAESENQTEKVSESQTNTLLVPASEEQADASLRITYNEGAPQDPGEIKLRDPFAPSKIEDVSNDILQKELELLKLSTRARIASTDKNRVKPWRTFLYNLGGSGVATAGIVTIASERWRTWKTPANAHRDVLLAGPILLLTSHSIIAGGILLEAALDIRNDRKLKKQGLDPKSTKRKALEICKEIDQKLTERNNLLASVNSNSTISESEKDVFNAETKVLTDLRNAAINEYSQTYVRAKRRIAARNISYINGFSAATTGGYLGSLCGILAVANRKPRTVGPGGIGFIISGANIVAGPVLGKMAGNFAAKRGQKEMKGELGEIPKVNIAQDISALKKLNVGVNQTLANRVAIYETADDLISKQIQANAAEKKKANKEFWERLLFNTAIGGTKIAWGVQLANAGFSYHPAPPAVRSTGPKTPLQALLDTSPKPKNPNQVFARRVAKGATTYIPGTSLWIFDTVQARTRGELDVYTMGQQLALPHQKLDQRIQKLSELESRLRPKQNQN
ncbi:MAG: hypothetical protein KIT34_12965 [Cyanobacteria bacterium TGS_CYA1]|nr:hypothetical protein [Cyanobacteria bacterium TGS_CYA1]